MKNIYNIIERDTIFFDLETTGVDIKMDRIVEICAIKYRMDKTKEVFQKYFNPTYPVSKKAFDIHGHNNESLSNYQTFKEYSDELFKFFDGCDIGGYNCIRFDIPILFEEFSRCGKYLNIFNVNIIDSYNLLNKFETRKLNDIYRKFFNKDIDGHNDPSGHHDATKDIEATIDVFERQIDEYGLNDKSIKEISNIIRSTSDGERILDLSGWFKVSNGEYLFDKGKHKDNKISDNISYLNWIIENPNIENNSRVVGKMILKKIKAKKN